MPQKFQNSWWGGGGVKPGLENTQIKAVFLFKDIPMSDTPTHNLGVLVQASHHALVVKDSSSKLLHWFKSYGAFGEQGDLT